VSPRIRGGQSIKVLQALLGHKSAVETWDTYGHLMGDEDTRSRAIVDSLLGGEAPKSGEGRGTLGLSVPAPSTGRSS